MTYTSIPQGLIDGVPVPRSFGQYTKDDLDDHQTRITSLETRYPQQKEITCSADTTITTSVADITGATMTFTTVNPNAIAVVVVTWDIRLTALGTGYCYGEVNVDSVLDSRKTLFVAQSVETRLSGFLRKKFTLASAASHTIKLQCHKDSSSGTALFCAGTTVLSVDLYQ